MRLLLDTNAYTALLKGDTNVASCVRKAEGIVMCPVVVGELLFGYRNGNKYAQNLAELEEFLGSAYVELPSIGRHTCDYFSLIGSQLRRCGKPIPQNDIWIAAHSMETGAALLTFDAHFQHIENLLLA